MNGQYINKEKEIMKKNNNSLFKDIVKAAWFPLMCAVLTLMLATSAVFAWFYLGRKATAMARISNPVTIYINAGNGALTAS